MGSDVTLNPLFAALANADGACVLRNCLNIDPATLGVCAGAVFCGVVITTSWIGGIGDVAAASYIDLCTTSQSGEDASVLLSSPVEIAADCVLLLLLAACVLLFG